MLIKKDYYDVLAITKPSNEDEIKKAYRRVIIHFILIEIIVSIEATSG